MMLPFRTRVPIVVVYDGFVDYTIIASCTKGFVDL